MTHRVRCFGLLITSAALCLGGCSAYDGALLSKAASARPSPDAEAGTLDAAMGGEADGGADAAAPADAGPCDPTSGSDCCEEDPQKTAPGFCGCGVADTDSDSDGTPNCHDDCPNDPAKLAAGSCGCGSADTDSDGDGALNCEDLCPNDAAKTAPGVCGCGVPDTYSDSDSTPDCMDSCPADPDKAVPGLCGCGVADSDADSDGVPDCDDGCPNDAAKTSSGTCGCGVADVDTDADGTSNCSDGCPNDATKTSAGACGCGVPDTDTDSDGTANCKDACPSDPGKTAAGECGCGNPDSSDGCLGLRSALAHRYSFNGSGTTVTDAKGGSSGSVKNGQLSGNGSVALSGSSQYVDMPRTMISSLTNTTLEAWVTWSGGSAWQRVFDCGNSRFNRGDTYVFLAASSSSGGMHLAYSTNGNSSEVSTTTADGLPQGGMHQVVAVVDDTGNVLTLYRDGTRLGSSTFSGHLSSISFDSCWLGRSLFSSDPYFKGTLYEFRVYDSALTDNQVLTSFNAGPEATFF